MQPPPRPVRRCSAFARAGVVAACSLAMMWRTAAQTPAPEASAAAPVLLTNLSQVVALTDDALRAGNFFARLQAVITYAPLPGTRLYLQDGAAATYVDFTNTIARRQIGEVIEVAGQVKRGFLVPRIQATDLRVLRAGQLPEARPADPARLVAGEDAMRFVQVRGVVRDLILLNGPSLMLLVSAGDTTFRTFASVPAGTTIPRELLDATIEARGMSRPISDNYGNAFGFVLYQESTNFTTVLKPGTPNLFDRPLLPIREALQTSNDFARRLKLAGTVLAHVPGKTLFLQDATGVLRVGLLPPLPKSLEEAQRLEHEPQTQLRAGEKVEVLAARLEKDSLTPALSDGEFRRAGNAPPLAPIPVSVKDLVAGKFAGRLVTLKARLLDQRAANTGNTWSQWLVLEADEQVFQARWESEQPAAWNLQPDSFVNITGVSDVESGQLGKALSSYLLLRSPEDVEPTAAPPFWRLPEVRRVLLIALALALFAAGWITYERRHLRRLRASDAAAKRSEAVTRTINYFATSLLECDTEDDVLWDLAQNCISQLGFADCVIYLLDRPRGVLVQRAAFGSKNPAGRVIRNPITIPLGKGIVGSAAAAGRAEWIRDTSLDRRYIVDDAARLSELAVPISANGEVLGVIDAEHPAKNFFTSEHLQMLTSIASLCANKLVRVHAEQALRLLNADLEQRVSFRTAELSAEVAAREQAEAELRVALQAEKELNQLKGSFVSLVSHEFRTPLGVILSSSNILDRYLERLPPEKRAAQLRAIRKSVHRMNDLIDDVLLLGKFDAGALNCQPGPVDLPTFCRRTAKEIESAAARDGAIQFNAGQITGDAVADEGLLQHILGNILGNAVKYSPPEQPVEFTVTRSGTNAEFVIRDHGCGIPAADQPRLFTAFYRGSNVGQKPGSGLGLVIAKRCVDLHGGTIRCESEEGKGTTFIVNLPLFDGTRFFRRRAADAAAAATDSRTP